MKRIAIALSMLSVTCPAISAATKINNFNQVDSSKFDSSTLVVSDVNDTLVACSEAFWQNSTLKQLKGTAGKKAAALSSAQKNLLANLKMQKCKNTMMADSAKFFRIMKKQGIPTLGLTAAFAEPLAGIDMAKFVANVLKNEGLVFQGLISGKKVFTNLKKDLVSGGYPTLLEMGALLTSGTANSKGEVLKAYIESLPKGKRPTHVVFFDDSPTHLKTVGTLIKEMGISVELYQMNGNPAGLKNVTPKQEKIWESLLNRLSVNV